MRHDLGQLLKVIVNNDKTFSCSFSYCFCFLSQASILDLHSGALSLGKHFVNLYR